MKASKKHFFAVPIVTLLATALLASCNSADDALGEITPAKPQPALIHFTAQLGSKGGNSQAARATGGMSDFSQNEVTKVTDPDDGTLDAEWEQGESVALIYEVSGTKYIREASVTSVSSGVATIDGELEGSPADNTPVKIVYPYAAADKDTESGIKADYLKTGQDGTLTTLSANYDVAVGNGNLSISGTGTDASLKEMASLANQYAICKFSFTQGGSPITGISYLSVDGITVRGSGLSSIYVAFDPSVSGVKRFMVINSTATYSGTASPSLAAGMFYRPTINLTQMEHEAVDLGLPSGTLWATYNVGASKPEEYGDYFAWGETEPYYTDGNAQNTATTGIWKTSPKDYSAGYATDFSNYFDTNDGGSTFIKYNLSGTDGTYTELQSEDDAATAKWGSAWCMPTHAQQQELRANTVSEWGTLNGVNGRYFYKKDAVGSKVADTYIFLPAAGLRGGTSLPGQGSNCIYWSRELHSSSVPTAWFLEAVSSYVTSGLNNPRFRGQSVRAVLAQ